MESGIAAAVVAAVGGVVEEDSRAGGRVAGAAHRHRDGVGVGSSQVVVVGMGGVAVVASDGVYVPECISVGQRR